MEGLRATPYGYPRISPTIRAQQAIFGAPLCETPHRSLRASEKNCHHPGTRADFGLRLSGASDRCLRPSEKICRPSGRNTVKLLCGNGGPPSDHLRVSENFTDHPDATGNFWCSVEWDSAPVPAGIREKLLPSGRNAVKLLCGYGGLRATTYGYPRISPTIRKQGAN